MFRIILFFITALFLSFSSFAASEESNAIPFATIADIHFDPFIACYKSKVIPCPLIEKLRTAPANQWAAILKKYDVDMPRYRQDTNYPLLQSALSAAGNAAKLEHAQFVMVLGDFLGHEYRSYYKKYSKDKSAAGYRLFVKKTLAFLTNQLAQTFPSVDVYTIIGNNDSYYSDYFSDPHGQFFNDVANLWSSLIKNKDNRSAMQKRFPNAGYYAVNVAGHPELRLIVLNTVLFSYKARGKHINEAAIAELDWLHQELETVKAKQQKAFIVMHIPPGVDIYAGSQYRLFRLIELWMPAYTQRFEADLRQYAPNIAGVFAGHLHFDWFQTLKFDNGNSVIMTGTPSISPIFGNNPGFKIYLYAPDSHQVENYQTYYYPLNQRLWRTESNFNHLYKSSCDSSCQIINGMQSLRNSQSLADDYSSGALVWIVR